MAKSTLGKVGITPRDEWNALTANYAYLDSVEYLGSGYLVKLKNGFVPVGTLPTNTTYFMKLVSKGTIGNTGLRPIINTTSITSNSIALGNKTFTIPTALDLVQGQIVKAYSTADPNNYMVGFIDTISPTTLIINVSEIGGSGTKTDWIIVQSGFKGGQGTAGTANFVTWTATSFTIGSQVIKDGQYWIANANTISTDVPDVSSKWTLLAKPLNEYIFTPLQTGGLPLDLFTFNGNSVSINDASMLFIGKAKARLNLPSSPTPYSISGLTNNQHIVIDTTLITFLDNTTSNYYNDVIKVRNNNAVLATDVPLLIYKDATWYKTPTNISPSTDLTYLGYDPQKFKSGVFFNDPYYEQATNGDLYFKPSNFLGGDCFFIRGGYYPDYSCSYQVIKDAITASAYAPITIGQTSPLGITDCIKFSYTVSCCLYFNPQTKIFVAQVITPRKTGFLCLINNNYGRVGRSEEMATIYYSLGLKKSAFDPASLNPGCFFNAPKYEMAVDGSLYMQTTGYAGSTNIFYFRGGYYPNRSKTLAELIANLSTSTTVLTGQTSPKGLTNCILIPPFNALYYNPITDVFYGGDRIAQNYGWIELIQNNTGGQIPSGTEAAEIKTQLAKATTTTVFDPMALSPGCFFNQPIYELRSSDGALFLKTTGFGGGLNVFYIRAGYYTDTSKTLANIVADLASSPTVLTGQTSPSGLTNCILIPPYNALYYNPTTGVFYGGDRASQKTGWIELIHNNLGRFQSGTEQVEIQTQLLKNSIPIAQGFASSNRLGVPIFAHRGTTLYGAPENSLDAYKHAAVAGYTYFETDVQYTSDNKFVILHDDTMNRTYTNADGSAIVGTQTINAITLAAAKVFRQTSSFSKYKKEIPTLDDFLSICRRYNATPVVEIKTLLTGQDADFIATFRKYFQRDEDVIIISFSDAILARLYGLGVKWRLGFLSGSIANAVTYKGFVNTDYSSINQTYMDNANTAGIEVSSWTVNTQAELNRLVNMGVEYITSDNVAPNRRSEGTFTLNYYSDLNFNGFNVTNATINTGQGTVTLSASGLTTSPSFTGQLNGAVYADITVKGNVKIDLLINGAVSETFSVNVTEATDYYFSKLINSVAVCAVRVTELSGSGTATVYQVNAFIKKFF